VTSEINAAEMNRSRALMLLADIPGVAIAEGGPVLNVEVPVEQFAAVQNKPSASKLAFTGYNAIPIVIGGLVLLGLGLFMRRRQDSDPDS